ncbi:acyltransferase [Gayadomonas joobiniege]|uniref:acyltransferase n=1 Tax=Gayadomonas joobiniege TaxID=1234606 RepID=UPI00037F82C4|nr:acyltransferase family protein [Gayadomonas joobiniege]
MRKDYIDYLRTLGIFAVITIHVTAPVYQMADIVGEPGWWLSNILNSISRFAVPLFVMISGAVLLGKSITPYEFYKRRSLRLLPPIIFWTLFYIGFKFLQGGEIKSILISTIYSGKAAGHLWYLTMFACLMMFAPFLNMFLNGDRPSSKDLLILIIVVFLFFILNGAASIPNVILDTKINWFTSFTWFIGYFICGYYLDKYGESLKISNISIVFVIVALMLIGIYLNYYVAISFGLLKDWFVLNNKGPFLFVITALIFLLIKKNSARLANYKTVSAVSTASFGMYLIHPVFIYMFEQIVPGYYTNPIIYLTIVVALTTLLSFFSIFCIRKIRMLKAIC